MGWETYPLTDEPLNYRSFSCSSPRQKTGILQYCNQCVSCVANAYLLELLHQVLVVLKKDAHALEKFLRGPPPMVVIAQQIEELRPGVGAWKARLRAQA